MTPEVRWLRAFVAVAEEGHFSRAARRLHLAQPALTVQVRQLEAAVGAVLFERTNRLKGLTAAGRALLPEARAIVERADGLGRTVARAAQGEGGWLRVGVIPPAATTGVAEALRQLAAEAPAVEVQLRQGGQEWLEGRLRDGDLDLVLGRPPEVRAGGSGLAHRHLWTESQGVVMRGDDPLAGRPTVPLRSLEGRRLVLLRGNPHFGANLLELAAAQGVGLVPLHAAEDFPSLHWMVRAGFGVAPCSLRLADALPAGLVARAVRPAPPRLEIHAIWPGSTPGPTAARWLRLLEKSAA